MSYREKTMVYHLTCIDNMKSIIENGLQSRSSLKGFVDIADSEIIQGRAAKGLEKMVPFHFFSGNPFDGRVKKDHPEKIFCLIGVLRVFAKDNNWKIIPRHPLATGEYSDLLSYAEGFQTIDWKLMDTRDYKDAKCKSVCMAECLSPVTVEAKNFNAIYVKDEKSQGIVNDLIKKAKLSMFVNINSNMC